MLKRLENRLFQMPKAYSDQWICAQAATKKIANLQSFIYFQAIDRHLKYPLLPTHHPEPMNKRMATTLDEGYKAMASDALREAQAVEWCEALVTSGGQQSNATADQIIALDLQLPRIITDA